MDKLIHLLYFQLNVLIAMSDKMLSDVDRPGHKMLSDVDRPGELAGFSEEVHHHSLNIIKELSSILSSMATPSIWKD